MYIRVPQESGREQGTEIWASLACVDDMDVLQALTLRYTSGGMLVQLSKVLSKLTLLVDAEVLLVAEEDDTPGGDQPGEIVLLKVGQVGKVNTVDFSADFGVVVEHICGIGEEVLELGVT